MNGRLFFLALMALSPVVIGSTVADEPEYARMPRHKRSSASLTRMATASL